MNCTPPLVALGFGPIPEQKALKSGCGGLFLSVVMPAHNEENSVADVILEHAKVIARLSRRFSGFEILVLDDGSSDHTLEILKGMTATVSELRVLRNEHNMGIAAAFDRLFHEARGSHIFMTASDGQWPAENLMGMLDVMTTMPVELVIGVRINRRAVYGYWRRVISTVYNVLPRIMFGVDTQDAGSIKIGRRDVFTAPVISRSPFADAERIILAQYRGCRVAHVPIEFRPRHSGHARGAKVVYLIGALQDCVRCFWRYRVCKKFD